MKALRRIRLINWHYLVNQTLDLEGSLYLFGKNESGKSSILDAIQFVLVGDTRRMRFNASAQDEGRSGRDLASYVRCKVGETILRPAATAYLALEFADADSTPFLVGAVIDAAADGDVQHGFFILNDQGLDDRLFLDGGQRPHSRRAFGEQVRRLPRGRLYSTTEEYQEALLNRFGQLNGRFFDLFVKAFSFKPVANIREFVYNYLLDAQPVDLEAMRRTQEQLEELHAIVDQVEAQIGLLREMMQADERRGAAARTLRLHAYLVRCATHEQARAALEENAVQQTALRARLEALQVELDAAGAGARRAQDALDAAQERLNHDTRYVQREYLRRQAAELRQALAEARTARDLLLGQLRAEHARLGGVLALLAGGAPDAALLAPLPTFRAWIETLPAGLAAPDADAQVQAARDALQALNSWARDARARLGPQIEAQEARLREIDAEQRALQAGGTPAPPREAEALRALLAPLLGGPPPYLYSFLAVPDESWQSAVEGLLGRRRFDLLVPPEQFAACLVAYEREALPRRIHGVRILDVARIVQDAPAPPAGSLARLVEATDPAARAYVDRLLGSYQPVEQAADLPRHVRAVTRACLVYDRFAVDHLDPAVYQHWFIGERARGRRLERLAAERREVEAALAEARAAERTWQERVRATTPPDTYAGWLARLPQVPALAAHEQALAAVEEQLRQSEAPDLAALYAEIARLKQARDAARDAQVDLGRQEGAARQQLTAVAAGETALRTREAGAAASVQAAEAEAASPEWVAEARAQYARVRRQYAPDRLIEEYERQHQGYETRLAHAREEIRGQQLAYQREYGLPGAPVDPEALGPYRAVLETLEASDLPRYREQIARARADAEVEFREHFLHRLRDQIRSAQARLGELNDALKPINFSGTRYHFVHEPNPEYRRFHDLILRQDADLLGLPLLEGAFYNQHKEVIDELFEKLALPTAGTTAAEIERLRDYRSYLNYDIELIQDDGRRERFSRVGRTQSGGKTQAPYYVAMVAAFAQLYRVLDARRNDTVRLIVFDEAFNRMDRQNTASALEMMRRYQLQVVTATPAERYEVIAPHMQTCLYLGRVGEQVTLTPYYRQAPAGGA